MDNLNNMKDYLFRKRYLIMLIIFTLIIFCFFFINQYNNQRIINKENYLLIQKEKKFKKIIKEKKEKNLNLKNNPDSIEANVRENHHLGKKGETLFDIFIK